MSRTDLLSDCLTAIRNAILIKRDDVTVPHSGLVSAVLEVLKKEEYIENMRKIDEGEKSFLKVYLKYVDKKSRITRLRRVSTPSRRIYVTKDKVPKILNGRGLAVISTSSGLLTDSEARRAHIGGEVLLSVW